MDVQTNERLTRIGPGTPAGEMYRRYWFPVAIAEDLRDLPKRMVLLGEELILFRDGRGRPGLLGMHCSHRGTSLEYGQIENDGIRCCYHGWLYDVEGRVLEMPAQPPDSNFKHTIRHPAYPCRELGGWIFTYMGPPEKMPELPQYEFLVREDATRTLFITTGDCNWLQHVENHMDPTHTALLHQIPSKYKFGDYQTDIPYTELERTEDGLARRDYRSKWWTQSRLFFPTLHAHVEHTAEPLDFEPWCVAFWTVPTDDTHHITCRMMIVPFVDGKPREEFRSTAGRRPEKTYEDSQRAPTDPQAQDSQGPWGSVAARDQWNLAAADQGVVLLHRCFLEAIDAVERGEDPPGIIRNPEDAEFVPTRDTVYVRHELTPLDAWRRDPQVWAKRLGQVVGPIRHPS